MSLTPGGAGCQHGRMRRNHSILSVALLFLLACPIPCRGEERLLVYEEVVTGDADSQAALPMLIAVHGLGGSPTSFKQLFTVWLDVPARVILPRGPISYGGGWSWFETVIRDGVVVRISVEDIRTSTRRLAALIDHLVKTRPMIGKPVITGFSQGGALAFAVAVAHPESVSGAIPMGGWLPVGLRQAGPAGPRAPPIRALHGAADTLVPFPRTKELVEALAAEGWDATVTGYAGMRHTVGRAMRNDLKKHFKKMIANIQKHKAL